MIADVFVSFGDSLMSSGLQILGQSSAKPAQLFSQFSEMLAANWRRAMQYSFTRCFTKLIKDQSLRRVFHQIKYTSVA